MNNSYYLISYNKEKYLIPSGGFNNLFYFINETQIKPKYDDFHNIIKPYVIDKYNKFKLGNWVSNPIIILGHYNIETSNDDILFYTICMITIIGNLITEY